MTPPALASAVASHFLSVADAALARPVAALYLYGSVALDDFHPPTSDIDFVAVHDGPLDEAAVGGLRAAHAATGERFPRPHFDGVHLTWDELAADPTGTTGPFARDGAFGPDGAFERQPVTWHGLAQGGVRVRGPRLDRVAIATDRAGLAAWLRGNLDDYWRAGWREATTEGTAARTAALEPEATAWTVLGVTRPLYTLQTGLITSKTGAGRYARERFGDEWREIVDDALRIRRGEPSWYADATRRRAETLAYCDMAISTAHLL